MREGVPKCYPSDLGELQSCPQVGEWLSSGCPTVAPGADHRSKHVQHLPFGGKVWQRWFKVDRSSINLGQFGQTFARAWQAMTKLGKSWPRRACKPPPGGETGLARHPPTRARCSSSGRPRAQCAFEIGCPPGRQAGQRPGCKLPVVESRHREEGPRAAVVVTRELLQHAPGRDGAMPRFLVQLLDNCWSIVRQLVENFSARRDRWR